MIVCIEIYDKVRKSSQMTKFFEVHGESRISWKDAFSINISEVTYFASSGM